MALSAGGAFGMTNQIPFSDDFESYANRTPLINGVNGWFASTNTVLVQTNVVYTNAGGTKAAQIPPSAFLTNRFTQVSGSNIWITMQIRPNLDDAGRLADIDINTNSTAIFYVNTNKHCVVYNGTNGWTELAVMQDGSAAAPVNSNSWSRIDLGLDYGTRTWSLFANYQLIRTNLQFASNSASFSGFEVHGPGSEQTNYLDSVSVSYSFPSNLTSRTNNWQPILSVDLTNVSRTIVQGQGVSNVSFNVWNDGGCLPLVFTNSITYTQSGAYTNWLSVSPTNDISHGELKAIQLIFDTSSLPASNQAYQAMVRIDGVDGFFGVAASNSPYYIPVSVMVQSSPRLWVSPIRLTNSVSVGHSAPVQNIYIANTSAPPRPEMAYTVVSQTNWISPNVGSGSVVDDTNTVSLTYLTENLEPGWHTGIVAVAATGISNQNVEVVMRVNYLPVASWNAGQKTWTNTITEGDSLAGFAFDVWNNSDSPRGSLKYTLATNVNWISLSSVSGTSTGDYQTVTVAYNVSNLAAGTYTGTVTLTGTDNATGDPASNSTLSVSAKLTVRRRAVLSTDIDVLTNSVIENCAVTNIEAFHVWNGSEAPRSGLQYTLSSYPDFLQVSPTGGTVTNGTNGITVIWSPGSRSAGTYTGSIVVDGIDVMTGSRASGAPKIINVQMTIVSRTPSNFEKPEIYGTPFIGQTLTARDGLWQNMDRLTFSYQWQLANNASGSGLANISGATSSNHVVDASEKGKYLRIAVTATDNIPTPLSATAYSDFVYKSKIKVAPGDFNSDGISDLWFFDSSSGMWRASFTANSFADGQFGSSGMVDVPGDYDGDGVMDLGLYDPPHAMWHVLFLPSGPSLSGSMFGGLTEETLATPVPADYDGDGQTDIALYWQGYWAILYSTLNRISITSPFAGTGGTPVPADYDGDGIADLAVYDSGLWTIRDIYGRLSYAYFGSASWMPAPADYDGDAVADICIYNQAGNAWSMVYSSTGATNAASFGTSLGANIPRQGYYDHDPYCDPATLHCSTNGDYVIWCVTRTTDTNFSFRGQSYQKSINQWRVSW